MATATLTEFEGQVFDVLTDHDFFDEYVCWPSQRTVAEKLGVPRLRVQRAIVRLIEAGWIRLLEQRVSARNHWRHNVYEILQPARRYLTRVAQRKIIRRAHQQGPNPYNGFSVHRRCQCEFCRPVRPQKTSPPPSLWGGREPPMRVRVLREVAERVSEQLGRRVGIHELLCDHATLRGR